MPFKRPNAAVKSNKQVNCVVKAFVDATPTSTPAFVMNAKSDSRTSDDVATLQIVIAAIKPASFAKRNAASVSAVSPDCEIVTNKLFGRVTNLR